MRIFSSCQENPIATETRKRTRLSPEARREQLVEIGAQLFAQRPFNDVWIEEVAEAAGVSRGLVYHYFPNKRDFFSAIVLHGMRGAFEISAPEPHTSPEQWLLDGIDHIFDYAKANANTFRAAYTSRHEIDAEVNQAINAGRDLQVDRIAAFVTPGEEASETLRVGVEGWSSMLYSLILEWLDGRASDREKLVKLAAGALAATIYTSLLVDGRADRLAEVTRFLSPSVADGN